MAENVLELKNLRVKYELEEDTVEAVNGVNIQLKQGETLGLVGETGAGKTTTALSLLRLIDSPPGVMECDKMEICGEDVLGMNESELEHIRGTLVSMIFQDPMTSLNPVFTVGQQIAESLLRHEKVNHEEAGRRRKICWSLLEFRENVRLNIRISFRRNEAASYYCNRPCLQSEIADCG